MARTPAWIRDLDDAAAPAWIRALPERGADPHRMMAELAEGIERIEAAREARNARNAAARRRARERYEQARRELYGEGAPVRVAAWAWAEPPPVRVW